MSEPVINEAIQGELDAIVADVERKIGEKVSEAVLVKDQEIAGLKYELETVKNTAANDGVTLETGARLVIDHLKSRLGLF